MTDHMHIVGIEDCTHTIITYKLFDLQLAAGNLSIMYNDDSDNKICINPDDIDLLIEMLDTAKDEYEKDLRL